MAYTPPDITSITFALSQGYSPPAINDIDFAMGVDASRGYPESIVSGDPAVGSVHAYITYGIVEPIDVITGAPAISVIVAINPAAKPVSVIAGTPVVPVIVATSPVGKPVSVVSGQPVVPSIASSSPYGIAIFNDVIAGSPDIASVNARFVKAYPAYVTAGIPVIDSTTASIPGVIPISVIAGAPDIASVTAIIISVGASNVFSGNPVIDSVTVSITSGTVTPVDVLAGVPVIDQVAAEIVAAELLDIVTGAPVIDSLIAISMTATPYDVLSGIPYADTVSAQIIDLITENAVIIYFFTLTGSPDIEIPISSFQGRLRSGDSSYLSVVIPGMDYAGEIADRSTGQMVIDAAYSVAGIPRKRSEIVRVNLDTIRIDDGPVNKSITLTGYRQETYTSKHVSLTNQTYRYLNEGKLRYRFAEPDLTLNPGDVVTIGDDSFTADVISYYVSPGTCQMEVSEA